MSHRTYWAVEPYIRVAEFSGHVGLDELDAVMHDFLAVANDFPAYFVLDLTNTRSLPTSIFQIQAIRDVVMLENTRWLAVVNPDVFANYATRMLAGDKAKVFEDLDRALSFLRGMVRLDTGVTL